MSVEKKKSGKSAAKSVKKSTAARPKRKVAAKAAQVANVAKTVVEVVRSARLPEVKKLVTKLLLARENVDDRMRSVLGARTANSLSATGERRSEATGSRNVHAVGMGLKQTDGIVTPVQCVRIYVRKKLSLNELSASDALPKQIGGFPVDVVEEAPARMLPPNRTAGQIGTMNATDCSSRRKRRQRPFPAGVGIGYLSATIDMAGTLGAFARSTVAGEEGLVYILSNNHVLADNNRNALGTVVLQPGQLDGGTAADAVAILDRFAPIQVGGNAKNKVDAALAKLTVGAAQASRIICSIGPVTGVADAVEDLLVVKHGRTTGLTAGVVVEEAMDAVVGLEEGDPEMEATFLDQIKIQAAAPYVEFGMGGDSGSLVVSSHGHAAVGLYFAGPEDGSYGLANPIRAVLRSLKIELL